MDAWLLERIDYTWERHRHYTDSSSKKALADTPDTEARKIAEDNTRRVFNSPRTLNRGGRWPHVAGAAKR